MNYIVIGLSNNPNFTLSNEVQSILPLHKVFSGGKRHYQLVKQLLPAGCQWLDIKGDMQQLIESYKAINETIIIFASGDPLFYGFAGTLQKFHPEASLQVYPHFNSLQLLYQKKNIAYQNSHNTSVHGRSWTELDEALMLQKETIGVLTDGNKTPAAIAERLLDYNFDNYKMIIGEALEGSAEKITELTLEEVVQTQCNPLNCVALIQTHKKNKVFGIADAAFNGLENRPNMITKMPIRLVSLSQLDLANKNTLWDIGFCTASVAIEAKKQFPSLQIVAFEKREECDAVFEQNTRKHSAPGIQKVMADFFTLNLANYSLPDAIFIGGHGNKLKELIYKITPFLLPNGRLVINAVKEESKSVFIETIQELNYHLHESIDLKVDEHNPITILTATKT